MEKITHPSRLGVNRQGDARDSLSLRRNGFTTEFTEVGILRVGGVGEALSGWRVFTVWGNYGNFWTGFDFCAANDAKEFGVYGGGGALPDVGNWGHYWDFYGRECGFVAATSLLASRAVGAGVYRVSYVS